MSTRPSKLSRHQRINCADRLLAFGKAFQAKAEVIQASASHWEQAASHYARAAEHYRQAGLGLMAKAAYGHASRAFARGGYTEEAARYCGLGETLPVYWEEVADD